MTEHKTYDVTAIGNALVDVLSPVEESVVVGPDGRPTQHMAVKGQHLELPGIEAAEALQARMGQMTVLSGGSGANSLVGLAQLGAKTAFVGKVADDKWGAQFRHDLHASGVDFATASSAEPGAHTGQCLIFITPDGERTMNTYLGVTSDVREADIDPALMAQSKIVYSEGYMWDWPGAKQALRKAFDLTHAAGGKVAFTLSAPDCIARERAEFQQLIRHDVDILFCNHEEAMSLFNLDPSAPDSFDKAVAMLQQIQQEGGCKTIAITHGARGSIVLTPGARPIKVDPTVVPGERVVDLTGAGDAYAAGFLYGQTHGMSPKQSGVLGGMMAADVIQHLGGRPEDRGDKSPRRHLEAVGRVRG